MKTLQTIRIASAFLALFAASGRDIQAVADERLAGIACRSVHWGYTAPAATAFYNEVAIDRSADGTYFCVCGFNKGYFGLQQLADGRKLLIFSVWDPGNQNDRDAVAADQRVKLLHQGEGVRVGRFGGEGTGGQSFFDFDWKVGDTYRFLVTAKPSAPAAGDTSAKTEWTEFAGYFMMPDTGEWKHLVTFATRTDVGALGGYYSFVEDFRRNRESTKHNRAARFGNGWVRTADGKWEPIVEARFTADGNPAVNINGAVRNGRFMLSTGGDEKNTDVPLGEKTKLPIDISRKPPKNIP